MSENFSWNLDNSDNITTSLTFASNLFSSMYWLTSQLIEPIGLFHGCPNEMKNIIFISITPGEKYRHLNLCLTQNIGSISLISKANLFFCLKAIGISSISIKYLQSFLASFKKNVQGGYGW
jgi:hypothetical protein